MNRRASTSTGTLGVRCRRAWDRTRRPWLLFRYTWRALVTPSGLGGGRQSLVRSLEAGSGTLRGRGFGGEVQGRVSSEAWASRASLAPRL